MRVPTIRFQYPRISLEIKSRWFRILIREVLENLFTDSFGEIKVRLVRAKFLGFRQNIENGRLWTVCGPSFICSRTHPTHTTRAHGRTHTQPLSHTQFRELAKSKNFMFRRPLRARIFDSEAVFVALTRNLLRWYMACRDGNLEPLYYKQYVLAPALFWLETERYKKVK